MKANVPHRVDLKVGNSINGKYTVKSTLGEGAFGSVFKVIDGNGVEYAMKLLRLWDVPSEIRQPLVDRFDMEFQTGQIESRYLVRSLDYGLYSGNPYIVMEFCPGGDLNSLTQAETALISKACYEVLLGLYDLHINGKVHRDLKPENVLFKKDGTAALTDFGISGDRNRRMTERNVFGKPNQIFGTYAYMPPEQVNRSRGMATVLPTTDIFSFGVVLYQLVSGKLPFGKLDDQNDLVNYQKRSKAGEWDKATLSRIPDGPLWYNLIDGCLKPDFNERLQGAKDAIRLLPKCESMKNDSSHNFGMNFERHHDRHVLKVMQADNFGAEYDLVDLTTRNQTLMLRIGRLPESDIVIGSLYASRYHCTLESDEKREHWLIRDGQWNPSAGRWQYSSNGTYVNSHEINGKGFWLEPGDIITIGDDTFRFE